MELDLTTVIIGGSLAIVAGTALMKLLDDGPASVNDDPLATIQTTTSKTKKSKAKQSASSHVSASAVAQVSSTEETSVEPAASTEPDASEVSNVQQKKKKKKKKSKKTTVSEPEPEPEPEPAKPLTAKQKKKAAKQKASAVEATAPADDDWVTVDYSHTKPTKPAPKATATSEDDAKPEVRVDVGEHVASVIGAKGAVIKSISDRTGARLNFEKGSSICIITGATDAVEAAAHEVRTIISDRQEFASSQTEQRVAIDNESVGRVVGKHGAQIKAIETESGARCKIEKLDDSSTVVLSGTSEQVSIAERLLDQVLNPPEPVYEATTSMALGVNPLGAKVATQIIKGRGGKTIQALQKATGARLDIDRETETLHLKGTHMAVMEALTQVSDLLKHSDHHDFVSIEPSQSGIIYGRGGANIRKLEEESDARITVESGRVVIGGTQDAVAKCKQMIIALLSDPSALKPPVGEGEVQMEIPVPAHAMGSIIGKGGSVVREIQAASGAKLDTAKGSTMCWITGKKANVEKARKIVDEKVALSVRAEAEREARRLAAASRQMETEASFSAVPPSPSADWDTNENWGGAPVEGGW